MKNNPDISVVIPLFNEAESLPELEEWIRRVMEEHSFTYQLLLVNDGSTDESWEIIKSLKQKNNNVEGISFIRNYGKSAALHTGFHHAKGNVVITMDADLQDSPDEIPGLYKMIMDDGYDLVSGWKKKRYDPLSKTIPTKFFNYVARKVSKVKLHDFNCGLKAYKKQVVKSIDIYGEMHRYIPMIAKWAGFTRIGEKVVQHRPRKYGTTKFGLERFLFGPLDMLSVTFVSKFRKRPMHFFGTWGTFSFLIGLLITLYVIGRKIYKIAMGVPHRDIVDQPAFFLALIALIIGVQLFVSGYLGEMMVLNSNRKNDYIIGEITGEGNEEVLDYHSGIQQAGRTERTS